MSSFGGQWKIIRHYLSMANLNAEVEKLMQKIKPATPEQWENLIKKFEKAVSIRLTQIKEGTKSIDNRPAHVLNASTIENTTRDVQTEKQNTIEKTEEKSQAGLSVGSEIKEITFESFLQGLKLKKDLHFGKISEQSWKSNKPIITKTGAYFACEQDLDSLQPTQHSKESQQPLDVDINTLTHSLCHISNSDCGDTGMSAEKQDDQSDGISIQNIGGVFIVIFLGIALACATLAAEYWWYKWRRRPTISDVTRALALMGYTGPTKGPGPNILSIDGGGIRGIIAIEILRHLEKLTGSGVGNLDTANQMYHTLSKKMFGNTSIIGVTISLSKTSIHSRTAYVISAIVTAETLECLRKRTEHFIDHLIQYPEARDYAIKEGAVRALLRVQNKLRDDTDITREVKGIVNEENIVMLHISEKIFNDMCEVNPHLAMVDYGLVTPNLV
ncbi:Calcium-independent phospholipase A2-gamma [Papilio machaon]|uniref:Calcium-independent phospholipase A2-gamma n=1 Tax=Papilio machaon TaxID=76193 RepID=A0A0N1PG28_PAPMA|nr:Calcium-independent phospholipase A2-gamma [Papilio machaon]